MDWAFLDKLAGSAPVESLQRPDAQHAPKRHSPELEAAARAAGFPDAESFVLWTRQREKPREKQTVSGEQNRGKPEAKKTQSQGKPRDVGIFDYIIQALRGDLSK